MGALGRAPRARLRVPTQGEPAIAQRLVGADRRETRSQRRRWNNPAVALFSDGMRSRGDRGREHLQVRFFALTPILSHMSHPILSHIFDLFVLFSICRHLRLYAVVRDGRSRKSEFKGCRLAPLGEVHPGPQLGSLQVGKEN